MTDAQSGLLRKAQRTVQSARLLLTDGDYDGAVPGNRLEPLGGNRKGQHSIRINDQWRLCFIWRESAAESVEIVDYH